MPESSGRTEQLADYRRQYRKLAAQLAQIGFIATGTLIERSTRCGIPGCACHADRPDCTAPTTNGRPRSPARPSPDASPTARPPTTGNGSTTTDSYVNSPKQMRQISARAAELILATDTPEGG